MPATKPNKHNFLNIYFPLNILYHTGPQPLQGELPPMFDIDRDWLNNTAILSVGEDKPFFSEYPRDRKDM